MSMIQPATLALVQAALDAGTLRQVAYANNIANAGTPGYRPLAVRFEEQLGAVRDAIAGGSASSLAPADIPAATMFADASAVAPAGLDDQVARASENALHYQALTHALSQQYALLDLAMSGEAK
jgi:flagellar basal-body rod protein FlgB